jgi:hypothetical protein
MQVDNPPFAAIVVQLLVRAAGIALVGSVLLIAAVTLVK